MIPVHDNVPIDDLCYDYITLARAGNFDEARETLERICRRIGDDRAIAAIIRVEGVFNLVRPSNQLAD